MNLADVFTSLGALVGYSILGAGSLVTVAYWLFKLFSERWLTAKFNERLEAYKHEQQKELEQLRFKIGALMDRTVKLHQREFDVLPEAWRKLIMADAHVESVVASLQSYPDLDQMSSIQLSEFIDNSSLSNWQKEELKRATDKTKYFQKALDRKKAFEARETFREFAVYFRTNEIFIREEIRDGFNGIFDLIHDALVEYEIQIKYGDDVRKWDSREKLSAEGKGLLKDLESRIRARLWDSQLTDT